MEDAWSGHAGYFLGACLGGFTIGRSSRGITVIEPALGGFLITGMLFGFFGLSPGSTLLWPEGTGVDLLHRALSLGAVSLVGGLAGSLAGERSTALWPPSDRTLRVALWQMWLASSSYLGCAMASLIVFLMVTQQSRDVSDGAGIVVFLILVVGSFASGMAAQMMARKKSRLASGSGPFVCFAGSGLLMIIATGKYVEITPFLILGSAVISLIGVGGAATAWHYFAYRIEPWQEPAELPGARLAR